MRQQVTLTAPAGAHALQAQALHRCDKHPEKIQYRELMRAFEIADKQAASLGQPIYVYACDSCGYFHLSRSAGGAGAGIGRRVKDRNSPLYQLAAPERDHPERDTRFVDDAPGHVTRAAIRDALRTHNPESLRMADLISWTGADRTILRRELSALGWEMRGVRRAAKWYPPGTAPEVSEPVPAAAHQAKSTTVTKPKRRLSAVDALKAAPEADAPAEAPEVVSAPPAAPKPAPPTEALSVAATWQTLPSEQVADMTVDQLTRAYAAVGIVVEVRLRRVSASRA